MDVIVRTIVKSLFPFILVFGFFIIAHGHLTPGGSFPGGAIIATGFAMIAVAFGIRKAERLVTEKSLHVLEGVAALILVSLLLYESFIRGVLGPTGELFGLYSSPQILSLNIAGGLMVICALTLIVFLMTRE